MWSTRDQVQKSAHLWIKRMLY